MRITSLRRFFLNTLRLTENTGVSQLSGNKADILGKIKLNEKALNVAEQNYMRKINERNMERYVKEKTLRKHYRIVGAILFGFVISIYSYTMFAINQEKFLDDFDIPEPPDPAVKQMKK